MTGPGVKILAPVSRVDEVEMLACNGAEELYCGLVPPEWLEAYTGAIWLNRRSPAGANLGTYESLAALVGAAHGFNVPVFLTLNAPAYSERQLTLIGDLARRAIEEIGIDALIVSDLGLLLTLGDAGLGDRIHVSSIASALNTEAMEFYGDLGASRLILPRALSLREIRRVASLVGNRFALEAFILNDGCAFEEGLCHTTHHHRVGAFCANLAAWSCEPLRDDGTEVEGDERQALAQHMQNYREWLWYVNGCGRPLAPSGLPYGPCGLCAIPELHEIGVASLKIAGREASAFRKLVSLRLVKAIVDLVRGGASREEIVARAHELRNMPEMCDSGYMCYYRDYSN